MARYLALTCEALARPVYAAAATSPHTVTVQFYLQGLHNTPKKLRRTLQDDIDAVQPGEYDAILLAYGLCGTATADLVARHTPVVMPRAHDCITLYLGARERYNAEFERHPGTYWYSVDYMERQASGSSAGLGSGMLDDAEEYESWVERWGQETADALREEISGWTKHYTRAAFIDTGLGDGGIYAQQAQTKAETEGWTFERIQGDRRLITQLVHGAWNDEEFLTVAPGHKTRQTGMETVIEAIAAT
jgi:hypothetical protein